MSNIGQIQYRHQLDNNMIEHELDKILVAEVNSLSWQQNTDEVMEVCWWKEQDILQQLFNNPNIFAKWFSKVFDHTRRKISE